MLPDALPLVDGEFALSPEPLLPLVPAPVLGEELLGDELLEPLILGSLLELLAPELLLLPES